MAPVSEADTCADMVATQLKRLHDLQALGDRKTVARTEAKDLPSKKLRERLKLRMEVNVSAAKALMPSEAAVSSAQDAIAAIGGDAPAPTKRRKRSKHKAKAT
eukprot:gene2863-3458_t